ncbi:MAG: hypothetical protein LBI45_05310 [Bacteroidales bacterium]|jgi:hypothetical protein|nr:hypothetical protein [Bacteroidales bacterium]
MPIKPENKKRYPKHWSQLSKAKRYMAGNSCEVCGIKNHTIIKRLPHGKYRLPASQEWDMIIARIRYCHSNLKESLKYHGFTRIVLTVGHLDHTPENNADSNLKVMCQYCHNRHDLKHRVENRRKKYVGKNQIELFINIQYYE